MLLGLGLPASLKLALEVLAGKVQWFVVVILHHLVRRQLAVGHVSVALKLHGQPSLAGSARREGLKAFRPTNLIDMNILLICIQ